MSPLKSGFPPGLKAEYDALQCRQFNSRVKMLGLTTLAVFYVSQALTVTFGIQPMDFHYGLILTVLSVATAASITATRFCKTLMAAKLNALGYCLAVLWILVNGPEHHAETFSDVNFILGLFFMSLLMPWSLLDVLILSALHFYGWLIYFQGRDLSRFRLPPSFFGEDPFMNGVVYLVIATVVCLVVRWAQNQARFENFSLFKDVECKKAQMEQELHLASRVHQTLMPASFRDERVDLAVTYRPVVAMGGDYARFIYAHDGRLVFLMADVTGHGVPAALMVNRLHAEFDALVNGVRGTQPAGLLDELNRFILRDFEGTSMYLSGFCGAMDFRERRLLYSNSGHPAPYMCRVHAGELVEMKPHRTLLGITADHGPAEGEGEAQGEIEFQPGDMLFFFTDGVTELKSPEGEFFGAARLEKFLRSYGGDSPEIFNRRLGSELENFCRGGFHDDILLLTLRILEGSK